MLLHRIRQALKSLRSLALSQPSLDSTAQVMPLGRISMTDFKFSQRSLNNLSGVHPDMVRVVKRAMSMQIMDFTVIEGVRSIERQRRLVNQGASKTMNSKHLVQNTGYGHAVDITPYPIDWQDSGRFYVLNGIMRAAAVIEGVDIRTGSDWDMDGIIQDQTFHDLPHYELTGANYGMV